MRHPSSPKGGHIGAQVCLICLSTMGTGEAAKHNWDLKSSDCREGLLSAERKGKSVSISGFYSADDLEITGCLVAQSLQ